MVAFKTEKILIVDDDPNLLLALVGGMKLRYETHSASDGYEALEVIEEKGPFDIIVSDMEMPGMNGVELLKIVAEKYPKTIRLMLTANSDQETAVHALNEAKIYSFIKKPCRLETLIQAVETAVEELRRNNVIAKRIQGADRAKADFISMISHELKTPLNPILSLTDLMLYSELPEEESQYLKLISASSKRLMGLIDGMVDYTTDDSKYVPEHKPIQLEKAIDLMAKSIADSAQKKQISFKSTQSKNLSITAAGDWDTYKKIIESITSNAIKFTEVHGRIVADWSVDDRNSQYIVLKTVITDTGNGFDPSEVNNVFKPFYQIDNSDTREHNGVGIGLALCKKWVSFLKGSIKINSQPQEGTQVTIEIPFKPAKALSEISSSN